MPLLHSVSDMELKYNVIKQILLESITFRLITRILHLLIILCLVADRHLCDYCHPECNTQWSTEDDSNHTCLSATKHKLINRAVYDIMSKNMVKPERPQMTIRWRIACWIIKATSVHTLASMHPPSIPPLKHREKYVILFFFCFPRQHGSANAPHSYIIRTIPVLFVITKGAEIPSSPAKATWPSRSASYQRWTVTPVQFISHGGPMVTARDKCPLYYVEQRLFNCNTSASLQGWHWMEIKRASNRHWCCKNPHAVHFHLRDLEIGVWCVASAREKKRGPYFFKAAIHSYRYVRLLLTSFFREWAEEQIYY